MVIARDINENVLKLFIGVTDHGFYIYVTISVKSRSRSQKPNDVPSDAGTKTIIVNHYSAVS